jgi:hypothetical protein
MVGRTTNILRARARQDPASGSSPPSLQGMAGGSVFQQQNTAVFIHKRKETTAYVLFGLNSGRIVY